MASVDRKWYSGMLSTEDWWALWLGGFVFLLGLGPLFGVDLLGWVVKLKTWVNFSQAVSPVSKTLPMSGWTSLVFTYLACLALTTIGAACMRWNIPRYMGGFTIIYFLTLLAWILGHNAYIAATPDKREALGITWSLGLSGEIGLVFALLVGLAIANFIPSLSNYLQEAARPEWFIKTAIVILGASLGIKFLDAMGLATTIVIRGLCAIIEAYLIYWPVVYFVSRKWFKLTPEWSAPLASGISICGVSAAIATGASIKARPQVPVILASIIVVFVAVELLILPFLANVWLWKEPLVAGAWMGLAVKSDGGAVASGALTDALIRATALTKMGVRWEEGWILMTTTVTKVFIDIFIGVWAFLLAIIWSVHRLDRKTAVDTGVSAVEKVHAGEIWERFPKFVIGYFATFVILLLIGLASADLIPAAKHGAGDAQAIRKLFFALTFFCIGLVTDVHKLWAEGMGKLVGVYAVCLFGFILWVGLFISWLFYHGVMPPTVVG